MLVFFSFYIDLIEKGVNESCVFFCLSSFMPDVNTKLDKGNLNMQGF